MPQKEEAKGYFHLILKHAAFSLVISLVLLLFSAILTAGGLFPIEMSLAAVIVSEAAGVFFGCMRASRRAKGRKLPVALLTGLCVFFVLLIAGFLFSFPPERYGLWVFLAALVPAITGGLAAQRTKPRRV